ncbi:MAG TPA: glycoside hydrolase family 88 protein [Phycisphaerae bacterium]|nr:glycoside hydrolase family 88 protein [Phycisphaerae bacterium]
MFARRTALAASLLLTACTANAADPTTPSTPAVAAPHVHSTGILPMLEECADAQLSLMGEKAPPDWTAATFYVGLARLSHTSTNPKYAKACLDIAEKNQWQVHAGGAKTGVKRRFFADDQAIGQLYIDIAISKNDPRLLDPLIAEETALLHQLENYDPVLSDPKFHAKPENEKMEVIPWWWCDSLFMNPPVLAGLSHATPDPKFIDGMDKAYWQTAALLYDPDEHLFYRDNRFLSMKAKNGKKVFWSRGDGWVLAGLTNILSYMPDNYPSRSRYEQLFKDMADKLLSLQLASGKNEGLWPPSLLDPEDPDFTETSGSAFFTYAFAWGINHHLLDKDKFLPATLNGWDALTARLRPDGQLGYVQPIGFKPDGSQAITIDNTQYYGNGAFLLAGCEILKLTGAK